MKTGDRIVLRGQLEIALKNAKDGSVIARRRVENTVVTAGRAWLMNSFQSGNSVTTQTIQQVAVGTGSTAPATSDTALVAENVRKAILSFANNELTSNPPSFEMHVLFATNEGNTTLNEFGVFNSSSGGTMLSRATFASVDKATSNTLGITYTLSN